MDIARTRLMVTILAVALVATPAAADPTLSPLPGRGRSGAALLPERPDDPEMARPAPLVPVPKTATVVIRNGFTSVQVNVDADGLNIPGDAANEPSIAVDPTAPNRIVVGWRQFDTVNSNFREAGVGYSRDGGRSWTFPGVIENGVFRSDPVLEFDARGRAHYNSLAVPGNSIVTDFFTFDGGGSWSDPVAVTPTFDSHLGWPRQNKMGDYYHMRSDRVGADLIYAATFNGEEDVYYLRLGDRDCDRNGVGDAADLAAGNLADCDRNAIPDACELAAEPALDSHGDHILDRCQGPRRTLGRVTP